MLANCRCPGFDSFAGRQSELDTTDTGTATVFFHDRVGTLDDDDLVGLQIMLQLYNPVTETWHPRWRGHIDDIEHDLVDVPRTSRSRTFRSHARGSSTISGVPRCSWGRSVMWCRR